MGYFANGDEINEAAEYRYLPVSGQHGYKRHNTRVLLARNQGGTQLAEENTETTILTSNFWREHQIDCN